MEIFRLKCPRDACLAECGLRVARGESAGLGDPLAERAEPLEFVARLGNTGRSVIDRRAEVLRRQRDVAVLEHQEPVVVVRLGHRRVEHQRILQIGTVITRRADLAIRHRQSVVGVGCGALDTQGLMERLCRLLVPLLREERHPQLVVSSCEALVQAGELTAAQLVDDGSPVALSDFPLSLEHRDEPQTDQRIGVVGLKLESDVELLDRLAGLARGGVCLGQ